MEIVIDGWLVNKGSPDMWIFKAVASLQRRRRWWFVLRSGQLPGQFVLEYFADPSCRKLKGKINLDQCQQVDAGVLSDKDEYVFALRTTKRAYYLASKTDLEMNRWVSCICSVCGLKLQQAGEEGDSSSADKKEPPKTSSETNSDLLVDNSVSNGATHSNNPYIPIFECFTGKADATFYDIPKGSGEKLCNLSVKSEESPVFHSPFSQNSNGSPQTPLENEVFIYDNIRPFSTSSSGDHLPSKEPYYFNLPLEVTPEESSDRDEGDNSPLAPPPRPPKPSNLGDKKKRLSTVQLPVASSRDNDSTADEREDYSPSSKIPLNCDAPPQTPTSAVSDIIYDFPKNHKEKISGDTSRADRSRHAYSNAPAGLFSSKDTVFNYEYRPGLMSYDSSPSYDTKKHPDISPTLFRDYANMPPSPVNGVPPRVHRDLKPIRKTSSSETAHPKVLNLAPPPQGRNRSSSIPTRGNNSLLGGGGTSFSPPSSEDEELLASLKFRKGSYGDEQLKCLKSEIQYLDLNLDSDSSVQSPKTPEKATIYKTVDFVKTKAFNVMRQNVEAYRKSK